MYFRNFEKGLYDLKNDGNEKLITDLMTRVKVRDKVSDELSLYDTYDVPSGERPEDTAFKHFGSAQYHWVILLTNNITDVYYDWPMSNQTFETFIKLMSAKKFDDFKATMPVSNSFNLILVIVDETEIYSVFLGNAPKRAKGNETKGLVITPGWKFLNQWLPELLSLIHIS